MAKMSFAYGVMGSGKSAVAVEYARAIAAKGGSVCAMKPAVDDRHGGASNRRDFSLNSRNGEVYEAASLEKDAMPSNIAGRLGCSHVVVDEAQFLTPAQVEDLRRLADESGIEVVCYGLRTDFRSRFFPGSARLMELADVVERAGEVPCGCGREAVVNARIGEDGIVLTEGPVVEIGDLGRYRPMCWSCWVEAGGSAVGAMAGEDR